MAASSSVTADASFLSGNDLARRTLKHTSPKSDSSYAQKRFQLLSQFLRNLLREEMAGRKGSSPSFLGAVSPGLQNIVHAMEWSFFRPQHEKRTLDFAIQVRGIVS